MNTGHAAQWIQNRFGLNIFKSRAAGNGASGFAFKKRAHGLRKDQVLLREHARGQ